jgi:capsular polysaccharide biosynthesis protein
MRNYSGQIKSRDAAQEVISRNQLDMTVDSLLDEMTVSPIESDFLLQIDVDDIDPQRAQVIAQTAAEVFVEKIRVYMLEQDKSDRVDVNIRDDATPATVFWPKTRLLTLAGGVLGLIAGALVVFGLEWLARDIIREGRDIERHVGLTVLGSIPRVVAKPR